MNPNEPPPGPPYPDDSTQPLPRIPGATGDDVTQQLPRVTDGPGDATQHLPPVPAPAPAPPPAPPPAPAPLAPPAGPDPSRLASRQRLAIAGAMAAALVLVAVPLVAIQLNSPSTPTPAGTATSDTTAVAAAPASPTGPDPTAPANDQDGRAMAPTGSAAPPATGAPPPPPPSSAGPAPSASPAPPDGPWSTIVDNSSGRFAAGGSWRASTDSAQRYGSDFRYAGPFTEQSDAAWYRVAIPATGSYRIDVWYPAKAGYNDRTPYVVVTTGGNQTVHLSQRSGGGGWVSLGTFELAAGDANVVAVSRWTAGTGYVIADAIRITRA